MHWGCIARAAHRRNRTAARRAAREALCRSCSSAPPMQGCSPDHSLARRTRSREL